MSPPPPELTEVHVPLRQEASINTLKTAFGEGDWRSHPVGSFSQRSSGTKVTGAITLLR
jgi:hypothetical protein